MVRKLLLVLAPLSFVLGASLGFYFMEPRFFLLLGVGIIVIPFLFKKGKKHVSVYLLFLLLGILTTSLSFSPKDMKAEERQGFVVGRSNNYFLFSSEGCRYYVYEKGCEREIGDYLSIKGTVSVFETPHYESRFDFKEYLRSKGTRYEIKAKAIDERFAFPYRKRTIQKRFLSHLDEEARPIMDSMLFGVKDYSSSAIADASGAGFLYVLSSGGFLLGGTLRAIEGLLKRRHEKKAPFITAAIGGLFFLIGGWKNGTWRVVSKKAFSLLNGERGKTFSNLEALGLSSAVCLLFDRYFALDQGFLLGYGISLFESLSHHLLKRQKGMMKKLGPKALLICLLFPSLAEGGGIHLLAMPYASILLFIEMPFLLMGYLGFLHVPTYGAINLYAPLLSKTATFLSLFDPVLPLGEYGDILCLSLYLLLALSLYLWDLGFNRIVKKIGLGVVGALALNAAPIGEGLSQGVYFLDVGQGDSILIRDGYTAIMIDTGGIAGFDIAKEVTIPFLRKHRIYGIDCLIGTHGDFDHIGAKDSLLNHYNVSKYIDRHDAFPLEIGNLRLEELNDYSWSDENDRSLVIKIAFAGRRWLFMGDASKAVEAKLLEDGKDVGADVIKLGHHGSSTSSSLDFLKAVGAKEAIISCGLNNKFGHPDKETLENLKKAGVAPLRTDERGTISYEKFFFEKTLRIKDPSFVYNKKDDPSVLFATI